MANIKLNNNSYPIPDSVLAGPTADFVSHLGTIAGNGLKVVVGGVEYGVDATKVAGAISDIEAVLAGTGEERLEGDGAEFYTLAPTALSFRSTAPLNELQEIQINGVTVDPSNYTLEEGSTIVTFPIDYLKTLNVGNYEVAVASESKTVKGGFNVVAPELNEYGFYYNQPYSAYVGVLSAKIALFVRADGTFESITIGFGNETGTYEVSGNIIVSSNSLGTLHNTISADGTEIYCAEIDTTFVLNDTSIVADEDYLYVYSEDLGGYEVTVIDKTKSFYGVIKTGINGCDSIALAKAAFHDSRSFTNIDIPDGVRIIGDDAFGSCYSLTSVVIPDSVTSIGEWAFADCERLTSITFNGFVAQWDAITKGSYWNGDVPATHVHCIDGDVAL